MFHWSFRWSLEWGGRWELFTLAPCLFLIVCLIICLVLIVFGAFMMVISSRTPRVNLCYSPGSLVVNCCYEWLRQYCSQVHIINLKCAALWKFALLIIIFVGVWKGVVDGGFGRANGVLSLVILFLVHLY